VNSSAADPATVAVSDVSLTAPVSTSFTKADLPAGTYNRDILPVKAEPAGWSGGEVTVNGYTLTATADGAKALFITGTTSTDSPARSVVNYNAADPAYDKNGITCDDNYTSCTITGSTVQGMGPTNAIAQNGIQAFGAESVTIGGPTAADANTVTDDTYTGGGSGNSATGILLLNNGATLAENNTASDSDVNIYAGEIQGFGLVYSPAGTWTINDNTVSGATADGNSAGTGGYGEGIQLDSTTNNVQVTDNNVSSSAQANILLTGVSNASIGGAGPNQGNTLTGAGAGAGLVVGGPGTECEYYANPCEPTPPGNAYQFSSTANDIFANVIDGNGIGVVVEGQYDPALVGPSDPYAAFDNDFSGNTWSGNLAAGIADFSGYSSTPPANSYGTPTPDSCEPSEGGSASLNSLTGNSNYWAC
jgi:hypothetical protein